MKSLFTYLTAFFCIAWIILSFLNHPLPPLFYYTLTAFLTIQLIIFILKRNILLYTLKRLAGLGFLIFIISTIIFVLLRALPGGPFDEDKALLPEIQKNIYEKYHLDQPIYKQYFFYMKNLLKGDLGASYKYLDQNVSDILKTSLPVSLQLGIYSLILSLLIGIPLGVFSAARHNSLWDRLSMVIAVSGISLPSFLTAPILILIFGLYLNWFPVALWEGPAHYILPVIVLGVRPASIIARLTRASVLDILHSDYIRTARAKGLSKNIILYKHVLKNSFIPLLTFLGPLTAFLLTGSFIIEHIFAIPGMSKHLVSSVANRDYPLILGASLVYCCILITANLIVDLLYHFFDPRIRLS